MPDSHRGQDPGWSSDRTVATFSRTEVPLDPDAAQRLAVTIDQLTQHLFEVGLCLHWVLDAARGDDTEALTDTAEAVVSVLDNLDLLIDDAARVALTLPAVLAADTANAATSG